jgi:superfamily II DNA or RNA helicase
MSQNFTLRPVQQEVVDKVIESAKVHNNILVQASCGFGKTVLASAFISRFHNANRKTLFIVDNTTLIDQTALKLSVPFGLIASGCPEPKYEDYNTFIAMAQTIKNRPYWLDKFWHLILVDECHTTCWYQVVLDLIERSQKWVIGLTATPYPPLGSKRHLADIFQDVVISPSFAELQKLGLLVPMDYYGIDHADFSKIKISDGMWSQQDAQIVNNEKTIMAALNKYQELAAGKRAIAFAVNVEHAIAIAETANRLDITAASITGKDKTDYRTKIFKECKEGKIKLLVSCMALTKGFDLPEIEVGLLMRPSKSLSLIEQQLGRPARIATGKEKAIIIDCVGNLEVSGFPCERVHTKESILSRKPLKQAGEAPVKTCPECERIIRAQERNCRYCAYLFPIKAKEVIDFSGEISQLITATMVKNDGSERAHKEFYRQLLRQEYKATGCTSGAYKKYLSKMFEAYPKPLKHWALGAIFNGDRDKYKLFLNNVYRVGKMRFSGGNIPSWWIKLQVENEFGQIKIEVKA